MGVAGGILLRKVSLAVSLAWVDHGCGRSVSLRGSLKRLCWYQ